MYNFQKYQPHREWARSPQVTLSSKSIVFSAYAIRDMNLSDQKSAVLYWDRDAKAIGIELTSGPGSHSITHAKGTAKIGCSKFMRIIGIKKTVRLPVRWDDETGFLVVELNPCQPS